MALTQAQDALLAKLNNDAVAAHDAAIERNKRMGRPAPPAPKMLEPSDIEWPKWVHKDWKAKDKGFVPGASKLVADAEELQAALSEGWSEAPSVPAKPQPKK